MAVAMALKGLKVTCNAHQYCEKSLCQKQYQPQPGLFWRFYIFLQNLR